MASQSTTVYAKSCDEGEIAMSVLIRQRSPDGQSEIVSIALARRSSLLISPLDSTGHFWYTGIPSMGILGAYHLDIRTSTLTTTLEVQVR